MNKMWRSIALEYKYPELLNRKDYKLYNDERGDDHRIFIWITEEVPKPSDSDMEGWYKEWEALEYSRKRRDAYPDWGTQLNKIYDDGIEKWKTEMVDPIKNKYPK